MNLSSGNIKNKIKLIFWAIFPIGLGVVLVAFIFIVFRGVNNGKISQLQKNSEGVEQIGIETKESDGKPQYFYLNKSGEQPKVSAKAYLVGDLNTGEVILSKNQEEKLPMASVSKLMTALVAGEIAKPDEVVEITKKAINTEGKNGGLRVGEKIKTLDLLYPLLLESSNDAAEAIAEHFGRDSFIQNMNKVALDLKMSGTVYEDPSGLSGNNQSTVADLFKLTGYIKEHRPDLLEITTERSHSSQKHSWSNISQFLRKDGYLGGKSGYTDKAKQTVISLFNVPLGDENKENGKRPISIAILGSLDRKKDVENILKYLKKNIYYGGILDATTNWVEEKIRTPEIKDPNFVDMVFAGDIMLDRGVKSSVVKNFGGDYSTLFENLEILKDPDIVFANLEGTASDKGNDMHNLYSFHMDPAVVPALAGAGVDVLSVANNHVGDWGRDAYVDTLSRLEENEILYTGGGYTNTEAEQPTIIEKYGMKIGFLGFSDVGPNWMEAKNEKAGLLLASNPRFAEIIKNASLLVDYLVVSFHFGDEYQDKHNDRQEKLAHTAADNGAKLVIGHHPHVIEDTEVYSPKDCNNQNSCVSFIAYSLGNFIFDQAFSEKTMQGSLLHVRLERDGNLTVRNDTVKLNKAFQPETIIKGREEKIKFEEAKTTH